MADITIIFTVIIYDQELERRVMMPLKNSGVVTKRQIQSTEEFNWGKEKYNFYGYEYTVKYNKDNTYKIIQDLDTVRKALKDLNYNLHHIPLHSGNNNTNTLYYRMSPEETIIERVKKNFRIVFGRNLRKRQRQQTTQTTDNNKRPRFLL